MKKRLWYLVVSILMVLSMVTPALAESLPAEGENLTSTVVILHTNDSHGRVARDDYNGQAGFTTVSAVKKAYEAAGATVLLLDAGDTLHGLPIATINQGADVVSVMNMVGYDAMTPGNHDFNYGTGRLSDLGRSMNFPLLSANTLGSDGNPIYQATQVIEKNGIRFGVFGITTPETAYKTNPVNVTGITFGNPITYAASAVEQLRAQNVDYIIALAHIGVDAASEFTSDQIAAQVPGIDIMIDAHSHTAMEGGRPVDASVTLVEHGNTLIASTGEYINNIGVVKINSDRSKSAGLIPYQAALPTDPAVDALVQSIISNQDAVLSEVVGTTAVRLEGERELVRKEETALGNMAADAFRSATGADVAFTNGGGIRASIEAGNITKKDLVTVFPFGNYVVTKEVTGAALLQAMEHGVKSYPELAGGFPQVSGITFQIDPSKPAGSRLTNVMVGGKALDPNAKYLVATNDFIAAGGDDFTMLDAFPIANEFGSMEEILISYIQANPGMQFQKDGRITVVGQAGTPDQAGVGEYIVQSGDSLWKIAVRFTGKGTNWTVIYEMNRDTMRNPDVLRIGQKLKIPA